MKNLKIIFTIVCVVTLCARVYAAGGVSRDNHHFVTLYGQVGYSALLDNTKSMHPFSGVAPTIGLGYHFYTNHFVMDLSVGAEYAYHTAKSDQAVMTVKMRDTEGELFDLNATIADGRDLCHSMNVNIPMLFGLEYGRVMVMLGPMTGVNVWGRTSTTASVSTTATYSDLSEDLYDMPNHQLSNNRRVSSDPYGLSWNINVALHAELGLRLGKMTRRTTGTHNRFYLGVYAEYGFLNIHRNVVEGENVGYREAVDGVEFYVLPSMVSSQMNGANVNPLTAGIKMTCLLETPQRAIRYFKDETSRRVR